MWVYIVIAVAVLLVYSINLTLKREHLEVIPLKIKETLVEPKLNEPIETIEYNRNDIPIDIRNKLSDLLYNNLSLISIYIFSIFKIISFILSNADDRVLV